MFLLVTDNLKLLKVTDANRTTKSNSMYHSVLPCFFQTSLSNTALCCGYSEWRGWVDITFVDERPLQLVAEDRNRRTRREFTRRRQNSLSAFDERPDATESVKIKALATARS